MLINGEKFACEACVRGHRVSSCQHQDRPLIHVNKKGRPISQCHHCRGLRKARAQHVKCDCAEKSHSKEDCPHEKAENKGDHPCCCGHGARCACSLKKEYLDTVPEDTLHMMQAAALQKEPHKPRSSNMNSHESKTTIFTNGHHKPVHKINDAHNKCGAPYKIPAKGHPIHGHREIAQRSSDSLPLTKTALSGLGTPPMYESVTSAPHTPRKVKSEQGSPELRAILPPSNEPTHGLVIPPLDPNAYSYSPFSSNSPSVPQANDTDYQFPDRFPDCHFLTYEQAHMWEPSPLSSAGVAEGQADVDWSTFNFATGDNNVYNMNKNDYVPSQPPSYASFDHFSHLSHPGLTSSSGEISEVEDVVPVGKANALRNGSHDALNDLSSVGAEDGSDAYRLSAASSYIGLPQTNVLGGDKLDMDDYFGNVEAQTIRQASSQQQQQQQTQHHQQGEQQQRMSSGTGAGSQNFSGPSNDVIIPKHPFTIQEAQNYAHMNGVAAPEHEKLKPAMPVTADDPMWSCPPESPGAGLEDDEDDDDWAR